MAVVSALPALLAGAATAILIPLLARFAARLRLVDKPGGRKQHAAPVATVGGLAIYAAVGIAAAATDRFGTTTLLLLSALPIVVASVADDALDLSSSVRFAAQIASAVLMIVAGGVELHTLGNLMGLGTVGLTYVWVPMTVFATLGVINAVNMIDGIDGLSGSVAAIALGWYALIAHEQGLQGAQHLALALAGGSLAFLAFNAPLPGRASARVFLGDAGSTLLGFALAWLAVDTTQGPERTFPAMNALWVVLLPLADTVSIMSRRVAAGRSPLAADRHHIHHYLLRRGFGPRTTLAMLAGASAAFGAVGYFGWKFAVPVPVMFWSFFFAYFAYHFAITRAWRRLEAGGA